MISREIIEEAYSYAEYRQMLQELLEKGKTTGQNQSQAYLNYAGLNETRMKRLEKTISLEHSTKELLEGITIPQIWLGITEGWCGDAAQSLPIIQKMAEESEFVELKLILRDENPDIMDLYLTDGGRSIPKIILLDKESLSELGAWGPRPHPAQTRAMENKRTGEITYEEMNKELQLWYAKDKSLTLQSEFRILLEGIQKKIAI